MSKKTVKIRRFIKTGLVLGAALAGVTAPLVAAPEPFILPVDSRKLEGYTQLLEAIRTQSLLPERSDLCRPANDHAKEVLRAHYRGVEDRVLEKYFLTAVSLDMAAKGSCQMV